MKDFFKDNCTFIVEFIKEGKIIYKTAVSNEENLMATLSLVPFEWDSYQVTRFPIDEFLGAWHTVH
jgi:hypothetical protein